MGIKKRIELFFKGENPGTIPYTVYDWEWKRGNDKAAWGKMFDEGLGLVRHMNVFKKVFDNVDIRNYNYFEKGRNLTRTSLITPVGEIYEISDDDWRMKYFIETQEDYRVMEYIVLHTKIIPCFDEYRQEESKMQEYEIPAIKAGRTPFQEMLVDMVGLENFSYHLYDYEEEINSLYNELIKVYDKMIYIITEGPGRFIWMDENFTSETLGPDRFKKYHIPVYDKYYPILQYSGKIVGNHYDGKLKSCKELVEKAPIDVIESLTPPGEGDMTLKECREAWPNKLFWSNIRVGDYNLSPEELKKRIINLVEEGAPDGKRLAFEVSEHLPLNWTESMPIVLKTLNELK